MKVISIINNKGGVGKTTTTLHLATAFAQKGKNVVIVDLDPQTNISQGYIPKEIIKERKYNIADFLSLKSGFFAYKRLETKNLKIIQGSKSFNPKNYNVFALKTALESLNKISTKKIDLVFIDCPPTVFYKEEKQVQNIEIALCASDYILIPIKADYYSYEGIVTLMESLDYIKKKHKKDIEVAGIFINQAKPQQVNFKLFYEAYMTNPIIAEKFLKSYIRENSAIDRAANENKTIFEYAPNSIGAEDFMRLYEEVKKKINNKYGKEKE